jgi:hypothetical protein
MFRITSNPVVKGSPRYNLRKPHGANDTPMSTQSEDKLEIDSICDCESDIDENDGDTSSDWNPDDEENQQDQQQEDDSKYVGSENMVGLYDDYDEEEEQNHKEGVRAYLGNVLDGIDCHETRKYIIEMAILRDETVMANENMKSAKAAYKMAKKEYKRKQKECDAKFANWRLKYAAMDEE